MHLASNCATTSGPIRFQTFRSHARSQSKSFALPRRWLTPSQAAFSFAVLVSEDFPTLHLELCSNHCLLFKTSPNDSEQHAGNDSSASQEGFLPIELTYHHQLCRTGRVFPL